MSIILSAGTLCLALASSVHGLDEPEKVKLEYTFRTGEALRYEVTKSSVMSQIMGDQLVVMKETIVSDVTRERIGDTDDGGMVVRQVTDSFTLVESTPAGEFAFDASSDEDASKRSDARVRGLYESLGWEIEYVMTPRGEVEGVQNLESIDQQIDQISQQDLRAELQDSFTVEPLIQEVNPFMHLLPEEGVGKGDTWETAFVIIDEGMTMSAEQEMLVETVLEWKDGHYVSVSFDGDLDVTLPPDFPPFMKLTESTIEGTFIFNTHYGSVSDYNSKFRFVFSGSPGEGMDTITLVLSLQMQYELKRD